MTARELIIYLNDEFDPTTEIFISPDDLSPPLPLTRDRIEYLDASTLTRPMAIFR